MSATKDNSEELVFADTSDTPAKNPTKNAIPWKLLIVDDQAEIHEITKMVLANYNFCNKPLEMISAFSGKEAKKVFSENQDIAVILLDVVMETENSGLEVIQFIRNELKNHLTRIILRTGQPGQAPEKKIIMEYDINDYKEKSELTSQKLFTAITTALRTYRSFNAIEQSRKGLQQIIDASSHLFQIQSLQEFALGVLTQLTNLLQLDPSALYGRSDGLAIKKENEGRFEVLAATGDFAPLIDKSLPNEIDEETLSKLNKAIDNKKSYFFSDCYVGYFRHKESTENILLLRNSTPLSALDKKLIEIFASNVSVAFDNIFLDQELLETQTEVIYTLSEMIEARSLESAHHVRRVAEICRILGKAYGLPEDETKLLYSASAMHDIGKIAIPDAILKKPTTLSQEEFNQIKKHPNIGHNLFKNSSKEFFKSVGIITQQHHERWDGSGYPQGLKEDEIHIFGRITAIADVFDAVTHKRTYEKTWDIDKALEFIKKQSGKQFDPQLVELFFKNIEKIKAVIKKFTESNEL